MAHSEKIRAFLSFFILPMRSQKAHTALAAFFFYLFAFFGVPKEGEAPYLVLFFSPKHACAKRMIVPRRGTMIVPRRRRRLLLLVFVKGGFVFSPHRITEGCSFWFLYATYLFYAAHSEKIRAFLSFCILCLL